MEMILHSIHASTKEQKKLSTELPLSATINVVLSKDELERPEVLCYIKAWQYEEHELFMVKATYSLVDVPENLSKEAIHDYCSKELEGRVEAILGFLSDEMGYVKKLGW